MHGCGRYDSARVGGGLVRERCGQGEERVHAIFTSGIFGQRRFHPKRSHDTRSVCLL